MRSHKIKEKRKKMRKTNLLNMHTQLNRDDASTKGGRAKKYRCVKSEGK